jgi:hypothetical protein
MAKLIARGETYPVQNYFKNHNFRWVSQRREWVLDHIARHTVFNICANCPSEKVEFLAYDDDGQKLSVEELPQKSALLTEAKYFRSVADKKKKEIEKIKLEVIKLEEKASHLEMEYGVSNLETEKENFKQSSSTSSSKQESDHSKFYNPDHSNYKESKSYAQKINEPLGTREDWKKDRGANYSNSRRNKLHD